MVEAVLTICLTMLATSALHAAVKQDKETISPATHSYKRRRQLKPRTGPSIYVSTPPWALKHHHATEPTTTVTATLRPSICVTTATELYTPNKWWALREEIILLSSALHHGDRENLQRGLKPQRQAWQSSKSCLLAHLSIIHRCYLMLYKSNTTYIETTRIVAHSTTCNWKNANIIYFYKEVSPGMKHWDVKLRHSRSDRSDDSNFGASERPWPHQRFKRLLQSTLMD